MKCAGKVVENAWGRAEIKGEAGVDVVLPSPVHAKEFPLRCLDWNHSECRFQVYLHHPGSFAESAKEGHSIISGVVVDGEFFLGNEVVDATNLWCRQVKDNSPFPILFWNCSQAGCAEVLKQPLCEGAEDASQLHLFS